MPQIKLELKPHSSCRPGEGEIAFKGRNVCMGYLRMADKTNETVSRVTIEEFVWYYCNVWLHYLFSTAITLVTVLMNWPPVFHLQWLGHVPHIRQHLPTTIVWNSPMRELIGSVMVSSLLLPTFGTLSLPLYFRLPSTFLPLKGRSITTLGARWHDFFFYYTF